MVFFTSKRFVRIFALLIFLIQPSCGSDEDSPVRINFDARFELASPQPAYFSFSELAVYIKSIRFVGAREAGNDVVFTTKPETAIGFFNLSTSRFQLPVTWFDIPEGVYSSMRWQVTTQSVEDSYYLDDDILSLDDCGMLLRGWYTRLDGTRVHLVVAIDYTDILQIESVNAQGNLPITLVYGNTYTAQLVINPFAIMGAIPRTIFEQAEISDEDDGDYLIISSDENEDIYSFLLLTLNQHLRVIVR